MMRMWQGFYSRPISWYLLVVGLLFPLGMLVFSTASASEAPSERLTRGTTRALAPVLLIHGGDTEEADQWYNGIMDSMYGEGNWDEYNLPEQGLPNPVELFMSVLGQYQGVVWHANDSGLSDLVTASTVLADYIGPGSNGKLVLIVPPLYQRLHVLHGNLAEDGLGIYPVPSIPEGLEIPIGKTALSLVPDLPFLVNESETWQRSTGIQPLDGTEILYQMEFCIRCYSIRHPYDPIVAVRHPARETSIYARAITITIPIHKFTSGSNALYMMMKYHMGFIPTSATQTGAGRVRLSINNAGYFGNFFASPSHPSLVYPYPSYVEHLYHGGIWIGARLPDGSLRVSTSADHYTQAAEGEELREFAPTDEEPRITSNIPESDNYDPAAIAPWQMDCSFTDQIEVSSGDHTPLGIKVLLRATSWNEYYIDDSVVLEYRIVNESGDDLDDVYFGLFNDTTVGNTQLTSPYSPPNYEFPIWNYYDDMNGGWKPGDLPGDPDIWMMWEHDDDGDDGFATSWVGCRYLGSSHEVFPAAGVAPVSYNAEKFRRGPEEDDTYWDVDEEEMVPGRYQSLGNGDFDSGVTEDGDFSIVYDWNGMLSTGPVPTLAAGDTLRFTFAMVGGAGEWDLMRNSFRIAELAANGWAVEISPVTQDVPQNVRLGAASPNPFNPQTNISFHLDQSGWTRLEVYSIDGRLVSILVDEMKQAGKHSASWLGRDLKGNSVASGLYLYRLSAPGGTRLVGHMTLVK